MILTIEFPWSGGDDIETFSIGVEEAFILNQDNAILKPTSVVAAGNKIQAYFFFHPDPVLLFSRMKRITKLAVDAEKASMYGAFFPLVGSRHEDGSITLQGPQAYKDDESKKVEAVNLCLLYTTSRTSSYASCFEVQVDEEAKTILTIPVSDKITWSPEMITPFALGVEFSDYDRNTRRMLRKQLKEVLHAEANKTQAELLMDSRNAALEAISRVAGIDDPMAPMEEKIAALEKRIEALTEIEKGIEGVLAEIAEEEAKAEGVEQGTPVEEAIEA